MCVTAYNQTVDVHVKGDSVSIGTWKFSVWGKQIKEGGEGASSFGLLCLSRHFLAHLSQRL